MSFPLAPFFSRASRKNGLFRLRGTRERMMGQRGKVNLDKISGGSRKSVWKNRANEKGFGREEEEEEDDVGDGYN